MQRRRLLYLTGSVLALAAAPGLVFAQSLDLSEAGKFVDKFAQTGIAEVLQAKIPQQERIDRFRKLFKEFFDIPAIARFTVGRFWKTGQPDEQAKFLAAFEDVVVYTWARRFSEYNGQTLKVTNTTPDGADGAVVTSSIVDKDSEPVTATWRVRKREDGWRVVDVIIEGVSMAVTYRQEYASILAEQGGFPGLITQLQRQASNLAREQKTG
jgi:phospholipid transport system substrate-binding protein